MTKTIGQLFDERLDRLERLIEGVIVIVRAVKDDLSRAKPAPEPVREPILATPVEVEPEMPASAVGRVGRKRKARQPSWLDWVSDADDVPFTSEALKPALDALEPVKRRGRGPDKGERKRRGPKGRLDPYKEIIIQWRRQGLSLKDIVEALETSGVHVDIQAISKICVDAGLKAYGKGGMIERMRERYARSFLETGTTS